MSPASLSIRGKLLAAFGLIFILFLGLGGLSAFQLQVINGATRDIRDNWMPSVMALGDLKVVVSRERIRAARVIATEDPAQRAAALADQGQMRKDVEAAARSYEHRISSTEERARFDRFKAEYKAYADFMVPLLAGPAS
ncbi:MAG TPA: MCP four helix bundle domain-containing protein, partial [Roseomonas sp.]